MGGFVNVVGVFVNVVDGFGNVVGGFVNVVGGFINVIGGFVDVLGEIVDGNMLVYLYFWSHTCCYWRFKMLVIVCDVVHSGERYYFLC